MQYKWLKKTGENPLVVFYNGWGSDEQAIEHLDTKGYDVIMLYDYNNFKIKKDVIESIKKYDEKYLAAWSMGVFSAAVSSNIFGEFKKKIAINGTTRLIDDKFGISEKIYHLTLHGFSNLSKNKFYNRMFSNKDDVSRFKESLRSIENQKQELKSLYKYIKSNENHELDFDLAIIASDDRVFPTLSQLRYYVEKDYVMIECGHYPFFYFTSWQEVINANK